MAASREKGLEKRFDTTSWSLVALLNGPEESRRYQEALHSLCERYWPPVYAYLRRSGHSPDAAADITQGFFTDVVFSRRLFQRADRNRAKLRTLIIAALKRYCIDVHRHKRAGIESLVLTSKDVSEQEAFLSASTEMSPESLFDQRWAVRLLEEAIVRCEQHFRRSGKASHWEAYVQRVVNPSVHGTASRPMEEMAKDLGFANANAVSSALFVVKERLMALLRDVVADHNVNEDDIDAEFAYLSELLSRSR
ncbi:MAG: sigma-70 family RNA polymerase sigma factor [Phycisphaerales bacterium]|nr:sigma-70 family RNA polymerase sigma factor [Phycisphaerales bacterium]